MSRNAFKCGNVKLKQQHHLSHANERFGYFSLEHKGLEAMSDVECVLSDTCAVSSKNQQFQFQWVGRQRLACPNASKMRKLLWTRLEHWTQTPPAFVVYSGKAKLPVFLNFFNALNDDRKVSTVLPRISNRP